MKSKNLKIAIGISTPIHNLLAKAGVTANGIAFDLFGSKSDTDTDGRTIKLC